ncbi:hypothetical protein ACFVUY_36755 [Kitasatospora sp. NPDC058063]|uniref:hypothetical protein n=1 Tax=unclassified Kitasatospora TaxID=2633591 RepID=UPI0036DD2AE6
MSHTSTAPASPGSWAKPLWAPAAGSSGDDDRDWRVVAAGRDLVERVQLDGIDGESPAGLHGHSEAPDLVLLLTVNRSAVGGWSYGWTMSA